MPLNSSGEGGGEKATDKTEKHYTTSLTERKDNAYEITLKIEYTLIELHHCT